MTTIPSTPADGNVRTDILTVTPADLTALTIADLTAGSVAQISLYLVPGGFSGTTQQETIKDDREPSTEVFGQPGRKTRSLSITGIDNTNSANDSAYNLLVDTLVEGSDRIAVRRRGVAWDSVWASGQEYEAWPFKPGVRQEVVAAANETQRSTWTCFPTGPVIRGTVAGAAAPVPTIASVLPSGATAAALVTITGDFLTGTTAVTFGGTAAAAFTVVSQTKIVASLPAGSAGSAAVVVTTPAGASASKPYTRA